MPEETSHATAFWLCQASLRLAGSYGTTGYSRNRDVMPQLPSGVGATTPEEERRGCVVLTPNKRGLLNMYKYSIELYHTRK